MEKKSKFYENRIFFMSLAVIAISNTLSLFGINFFGLINDSYYPMYAIDYSIGFASRILAGQIVHFFTDNVNMNVIAIILVCFYAVMCIFICLLINNAMKKADSKVLFIYCILVLSSPIFLSFLKFLGTMDIFWALCTIAALVVVNKKYVRWLVPLICGIGLAFHNAYIIAYMPAVFLFVIYQYIKKPTRSNLFFVVTTLIIAMSFAAYFVFWGDSTISISSDDLVKLAKSRLHTDFDEIYIRYSFYGEVPESVGSESVVGFWNYLKFMFSFTANDISYDFYTYCFISSAAVSAPFYWIIIKKLKGSQNLLQKLFYLCHFIPIIGFLLTVFLSTDTGRFTCTFNMSIMLLTIFYIRSGDEQFIENLKKLDKKISTKTVFVVLILAVILSKFIISEM